MSTATIGTVSDASYDPISLEDCKLWLIIPTTVTSDDDFIDKIRLGVISGFEKACGTVLMERLITDERHDIICEYQDRVLLLNFPIGTVDSIYDNETTLVSSDDYAVRKQTGTIILKNSWFTKGIEYMRATYYAGYNETNFPDDIIEAMLDMVKMAYDENVTTKDTFSEKMGRVTVTKKAREGSYPPNIQRVIDKYGDRGF